MARSRSELQGQVRELESQLSQARAALKEHDASPDKIVTGGKDEQQQQQQQQQHKLHNLLLLADSALPLGSFAFSAGLESFIAHTKHSGVKTASGFTQFVELSLESMALTTAPYVTTAFHDPTQLETLDNDIDASITCAVARRASVSQGRALVAVWERSFRAQARLDKTSAAYLALESSCKKLKIASLPKSDSIDELESPFALNGHLPPVFGVLGLLFDISLDQLMYLYLLNHAKTLLSAGIRASAIGPYQAQSLLASPWLTEQVGKLVNRELQTPRRPEEAGQSVPMIDLWGGRHEIVYSRIFNS